MKKVKIYNDLDDLVYDMQIINASIIQVRDEVKKLREEIKNGL